MAWINSGTVAYSHFVMVASVDPAEVVLGEYAGQRFGSRAEAEEACDHALELLAADEDVGRWADVEITVERVWEEL